MRIQTMWLSIVLIIGVFGVGCNCNGECGKEVILCGEFDTDDANECVKRDVDNVQCCFLPNAKKGSKCVVNATKIFHKEFSSEQDVVAKRDEFASKAAGVFTKPSNADISKAANNVPGADSEDVKRQLGKVQRNFNTDAQQRSLTFLFAALGGSGNFLESSLYPKCPVHVKYCYRVSCGSTYDLFKESNAKTCLSDPTCCYDYSLAFMRSILGPGFMKGTPVCYYGATSNQWKFVTKFFTPWNPWYTSFILEAFASVFDTSAFDAAGQFACSITGMRKAYPVGSKSKLECSLVSGCWHDTLPVGSKCTMASSFAQNIFSNIIPGFKKEVYPSLYTSDPSDTQCSSNWFDYGPKAYRRMPCGIGEAPTNLFEKLNWCPLNDCCLNYASLNPQDISLLQLYNGGGTAGSPFGSPFGPSFPGAGAGSPFGPSFPGAGAGSPFGPSFPGAGVGSPFGPSFPGTGVPGLGGTSQNTLLVYLLQSSGSSTSLSDLFCPFKNLFSGSSSLFPDLSEYTDGCCTIPDCYHKKKVREGVPLSWGQWSDCSNLCGTGTRTRQCFASNRRVSPLNCGGGSSTERCTGTTCTTLPPTIPEWTAWSGCSVTCGSGVRTRMCYYNGQQVSPNRCGFGPATDQCFNGPCPTAPPQPKWTAWSGCSVSCGSGIRTRMCYHNGQQVSPNRCGFGPATDQCFNGPCPTAPPIFASWGQWTSCSVTCGDGVRTRSCIYDTQEVEAFRCGGPGASTRQCFEGICPTSPPLPPAVGAWGRWQASGGCSATCGGGTQQWTRPCLIDNVQTDPSRCPGGARSGSAQANCGTPDCPSLNGVWSSWADATNCGATCGRKRLKRQSRTCASVYGEPLPETACIGESMQVVPCPDIDCTQAYYWTGYTTSSSCSYDSASERCSRKTTRYCYQKNSLGWSLVQPQSLCGKETEKQQDCDFQQCLNG